MARLEALTVALSATVLGGSDGQTLMRGAGRIDGTAFPGDRGNIGIAGHRDTIFRPVRELKVGDHMVLTTANRVFWYRISKTAIEYLEYPPRDLHRLAWRKRRRKR